MTLVSRARKSAIAVSAMVALVLVCRLDGYLLLQIAQVLVYAIALLGLNILSGVNGQISLGHGAFFAIGAYTAAILLDHSCMPYWAAVPLAGALAYLAGLLVGFPALRLDGHYLALATFALAVTVPQVLKCDAVAPWSGGVQGLSLSPVVAPWGLPLSGDQWLLLYCLAWTMGLFLLARKLLGAGMGRAMRAIPRHPVAAQACGIPAARIKTVSFAISAMMTGIAGALAALLTQYVSPDSFQLDLSILFMVGIVVGGVGSLPGALIGAVFIQFVPALADDVSKAAPGLVYGVLLMVVMRLCPGGLAGLGRALAARWRADQQD